MWASIAQLESRPVHSGNGVGRPLRKAELTRLAILEQALYIACQEGLEALSLGSLAEQMQMSKTGVFARFGSIQALRIDVLRAYRRRFEERVFYPSLAEPCGLPRLEAMFFHWARHVVDANDNGCLYISGAAQYDGRPGPIRDELLDGVLAWRQALDTCIRRAIEAGHLRRDSDAEQILYEMYGLILALHHDARFIRDPNSSTRTERAFRRLLEEWRSASRPWIGPQGRRPDENALFTRHFDARPARHETTAKAVVQNNTASS